MAVDTRDKRMSMIGFDQQENLLMVNPIGAIGRPGREMLLNLYAGIPLAAPPAFNPEWAMNANAIVMVPQPTPIID